VNDVRFYEFVSRVGREFGKLREIAASLRGPRDGLAERAWEILARQDWALAQGLLSRWSPSRPARTSRSDPSSPQAQVRPLLDLEVDSASCTGCGACAAVCAFGAIALDTGIAHVVDERCTRCMMCVQECPAQAIRLVGAMGTLEA
jgi:ferredoxin